MDLGSREQSVVIDFVHAHGEATDATIRNHKLERLHRWLRLNLPGYVGLYEAGSTTAGDPWVSGRSDRDIAIVFTGTLLGRLTEIRRALRALAFDDTYLFNPVRKSAFLRTSSDQDISMKFRGQVLFGPDLIPEKETPSPEFAREVAQAGLRTLRGQLSISELNAECWSIELLRDKLYTAFKLLLMYLADGVYADTGRYPRTRLDVAAAHGSTELLHIAHVLARIDDADRAELILTTRMAREAVKNALVA